LALEVPLFKNMKWLRRKIHIQDALKRAEMQGQIFLNLSLWL
jgi:hypothetical protein